MFFVFVLVIFVPPSDPLGCAPYLYILIADPQAHFVNLSMYVMLSGHPQD